MKVKCPNCYTSYSLESAISDDAAREFSVLMADLPCDVSRPLIAYVGLFRSRSRSLAWDRALGLAREALAMSDHPDVLARALTETVESLRAKQQEGNWKPLTGHNYLKRVLENQCPVPVAGHSVAVVSGRPEPQPEKISKTQEAVEGFLGRYGVRHG